MENEKNLEQHEACMGLYYGSDLGEDIDHVVFENIFDAGSDSGYKSREEEIKWLRSALLWIRVVRRDRAIPDHESDTIYRKCDEALNPDELMD